VKGAALGLALPVDPGEYVIVTHVPGAAERESKVSVQLGEAKHVQLDTTSAPAAPVGAPEPAAPIAAPTAPASEPAPGEGRKTGAYVAGGIGVAGIVVGSVTGILVLSKKGTVKDNCTGGACNDAGLDAANSGKALATVSDIGFGIGLAGLAVGAIFLLTGNDSSSAAAEHARVARWQPVLISGNGLLGTGLSKHW
jgi:hypothetical protein